MGLPSLMTCQRRPMGFSLSDWCSIRCGFEAHVFEAINTDDPPLTRIIAFNGILVIQDLPEHTNNIRVQYAVPNS